jgi:predicted kinase
MDNRKVTLTIGIIASGKSTWSKQYVKDHKDTYRLSRDDLRFTTTSYNFNKTNEKIVDTLYRQQIEYLLKNTTFNIILDEQNLNVERREKFIEWIWSVSPGIIIEYKYFPITLDLAIQRDKQREFKIGERVIRDTWEKNKELLEQMLIDYPINNTSEPKPERDCYDFTYDPNKINAFCVDCDGTLSHKHKDRGIFDLTTSIKDIPIIPVITIVQALYKAGYPIIICSGREEKDRQVTEEFFKLHSVLFTDLFMRTTGDYRKDSIVKEEIYRSKIEPYYNVMGWIDDRIQVLNHFQTKLGIFTVDVRQDARGKNNF